jgi:hypothetical protein
VHAVFVDYVCAAVTECSAVQYSQLMLLCVCVTHKIGSFLPCSGKCNFYLQVPVNHMPRQAPISTR